MHILKGQVFYSVCVRACDMNGELRGTTVQLIFYAQCNSDAIKLFFNPNGMNIATKSRPLWRLLEASRAF